MTGTIRWVGLSCAVSAMMGCSYEMDPDARVNIAPEVRIQTPEDGETVLSEGAVELLGTVFDAQGLHTIDTLTWTSSIDGELGSPELAELDTQGHTRVTTVLSEGLHVLSLTAVDTDQAMGMDTALVTVEAAPDAPVADLVQPVSFESVHMGQDVALFGVVSDEQDDASDLWVSWTVKEHTAGETDLLSEGSPDDSGAVSSSWTPDSPGTYIVGLTVSDTQGNEMHAAAYVFVHDPVGLDLDGDGYTPGQGDCDDADASVSPVAEERCGDGIDNDCSGDLDDRDFDDDGFIDVLCSSYVGTRPTGDCDDEDAATYPGAAEVLDGVDNSCDGRVDDGTESWDMDGDCACPGESCTGSESSACGVVSAGDCDDSDATVYPLADEVCNGMDDNCNGAVDDEDSGVDTSTGQTFYQDGDADGFGDATSPRMACETPAGHVLDDTDCDDSDASVWPGAIELCNGGDDDCDGMTDEADAADALTFYLDADGDSYGRGDWTTMACSAPAGYVADDSDCDDGDDAVYPGASEICNGVDDDCDLRTDDADAGLDTTSATTWSRDADADGYGTKTTQSTSCVAPTGYVEDDSDCDDSSRSVHPGASEICNTIDDDCDGDVDDDDASVVASTKSTWYRDSDGDGYGRSTWKYYACEEPSGYVASSTDCDDSNKDANPGATETCNLVDDDCDGVTDEDDAADAETWYLDGDGDGYGRSAVSAIACVTPTGYADVGTDCDDLNGAIHPDADEVCNSIDDNCDGDVDDDDSALDTTTATTFYLDNDGDGYGVSTTSRLTCVAPGGFVGVAGDCNDSVSSIYPGASEYCDSVDQDCDGVADDTDAIDTKTWYLDADGDGYGVATTSSQACSAPSGYESLSTDCDDANSGVNPAATEVCNSIDDDCDGAIDDADGSLDVSTGSTYYTDSDSDGYGATGSGAFSCTAPSGSVSIGGDCDDTTASVRPGATEYCDSTDSDCDGVSDDDDAVDAGSWYVDDDGDGYGNPDETVTACTRPSDATTDNTDCHDDDSTAYPGSHATETPLDGVDQDCDGEDVCDDLNCDGQPDVMLVASTSTYKSELFFNDYGSFAGGWSSTTLSASSAYRTVVDDLDDDGYEDILSISNGAYSAIYWGSASGYSSSLTTTLTVSSSYRYGRDACIADLDDDGHKDIVMAVYSGSYSYIYWGGTGAYTWLPTGYGTGCAIEDLDQDGYLDVYLHSSGTSTSTSSHVYYGNSSATYSSSDRQTLSHYQSKQSVVADVDGDGYTDIIQSGYYDGNYYVNTRIWYGSSSGYSSSRLDQIAGYGVYDIAVSDLDQDGYQDIVMCSYYSGSSYSTTGYIYYGASSGFSTRSRTSITQYGCMDVDVADLDNDGFDDIVFGSYYGSYPYTQVYYSNSGTFSSSSTYRDLLYSYRSVGQAIADLDNDGYLDIVTSSYGSSSYVYYGSGAGFSTSSRDNLGTTYQLTGEPLIVGRFDR